MCTRPGIQKSRKRVQAGEKHFQAFLPGKIYPSTTAPTKQATANKNGEDHSDERRSPAKARPFKGPP